MPRSAITISKQNSINGASTNYRDAIDAANKHEFTPTDLNNCILLISNTTAAEKDFTIEGLAGANDIVLTLAAGDGTEQLAVYDCSALDATLYEQVGGEIYLEPEAGMTGFVQVCEVIDDTELTLINETADEAAIVTLASIDGAAAIFEPSALGNCVINIHNSLSASSGANDKYVTVKAGDTGNSRGTGDKLVLCPENAMTAILGKDLDSSRFQNEDGTVYVRIEDGLTGFISVVEN